MSEPVELVDKNYPNKVLAYACPVCRYVISQFYDDSVKNECSYKAAARHCAPHCTQCDVVLNFKKLVLLDENRNKEYREEWLRENEWRK